MICHQRHPRSGRKKSLSQNTVVDTPRKQSNQNTSSHEEKQLFAFLFLKGYPSAEETITSKCSAGGWELKNIFSQLNRSARDSLAIWTGMEWLPPSGR